MILLFSLTALLILLYLAYPVWLWVLPASKPEGGSGEADNVSIVLISYNGMAFLESKIAFLQREMQDFRNAELIIIDDCSTDGSREYLENLAQGPDFRVVCKSAHHGIPHSMNLGSTLARYETLIFCDQRQQLSPDILKKLTESLRDPSVGAVSACISVYDKNHRKSYLRLHENFLKIAESRSGTLIGVYGPLYAVRHSCYHPLPEAIILDDLYLSLAILSHSKIVFRADCEVFDDNFSTLYDYQRTRRYLRGFLQILRDPYLKGYLSPRQKLMLFWHKYLRLSIPLFLVLCVLALGFRALHYPVYGAVCGGLGIFALISLQGSGHRLQFRFRNLTRLILFYSAGMLEVFTRQIFPVRK